MNRVFPNLFMNWIQFRGFFQDFGWPLDSISKLFKCFQNKTSSMGCSSSNFYLSFSDFLSGIAALEPETHHGGVPGKVRSTLIFRYYSSVDDNDSEMTFDDFVEMISDIRNAKGLSTSNKQEIIDEATETSK